VVSATLPNSSQNPLAGVCGIGEPFNPDRVTGFGGSFVVPPDGSTNQSFSGMVTVTQGSGILSIHCVTNAAQPSPVTAASPTWWAAKITTS
jgi:hypothetical protein